MTTRYGKRPDHLSSHLDTEMIIARIDVSRAFDIPCSHDRQCGRRVAPGQHRSPVLCLSRELGSDGARLERGGRLRVDYLNIRRYYRRARQCSS
jgi:hypothetical protein